MLAGGIRMGTSRGVGRLLVSLVLVCLAVGLVGVVAASAHDCTVDIHIYDAQKTTVPPVPVSEEKEETRGAFAVLNSNDTDKNGEEDLGQSSVAGEVDLMKLVLNETNPPSEVATLSVGGTDRVKLWSSPTKGSEVPPDETDGSLWTFDSLPQTLWVEGIKASASVQDVVFTFTGYHSHPQPPPAPSPTPVDCGHDVAKATIVWAQFVDAKHGKSAQTWKDFTDPPKHVFDRRCGGGFGLRPIADDPRGVANCIGMQFVVQPVDVWKQTGVVFDITRQRQQRTWEDSGKGFKIVTADNFPAGDKPNDDRDDEHEGDSSTAPTADGHLFSVDGPGPTGDNAGELDRIVHRFNMLEFVRVRFDGGSFSGSQVDGSRCSPKFAWHATHRLRAEKPKAGVPKQWVRTSEAGKEAAGVNDVAPGLLDKIGDPP
jgi:hypothetical protein